MWLKTAVACTFLVLGTGMAVAQGPSAASAPRDIVFDTRGLVFQTLDLVFHVEDIGGQVKETANPTVAPAAAAAPAAQPPVVAKPPAVVAAPAPPAIAAPAVVSPKAPLTPLGRRVALVIGNANYRAVPKLANPLNDARVVAAALRAASFTEVIEQYDLGVRELQRALSAFEGKATGADWAVVYYAGHGIEVDGRNFLIPIDAQLKRASDVEDETFALSRVMARVAVARKLQLVILDACRENPFAARMVRSGDTTRTVGTRGLAPIDPEFPNLIVAYAARDGQVALDGQGYNSPYAKALAKYLREPGLELGIFFRRVRADVLAETSGKQRPFEYGSLTDENLFFRPLVR
jgi:Caspase domain